MANPRLYFVDGFRWSILGFSDISPWISGGVTVAFAGGILLLAVYLFRTGYKLIV